MKFAPDVGQLQKAARTPPRSWRFLPIVTHMHLKDSSKDGNTTPAIVRLGEGKVDIVKILDLVEGAGHNPDIMVELTRERAAAEPLETAQQPKPICKSYGNKFKG